MEHHLTVSRTASYQQLGTLSARTRRVWFVCHGYGQLAAYFVRHFAFLAEADPTTVVIAPEGLSRFYLTGNGGRVGASWMTRDDRLHEIADHINFLNQLSAKCWPIVQPMFRSRCSVFRRVPPQYAAGWPRRLFGRRSSSYGPAASPKT